MMIANFIRSVRWKWALPGMAVLVTADLLLGATTSAQQTAPPAELDANQATKLAELMCRQLPNVATILEIVPVQAPDVASVPVSPEEPSVTDDVYDALVRLGPYSLPCLTDRLVDTRWMPDPRSEPLLGVPLVGDVAYMILMDKGVEDVLPALAHKKPDDLRMDDYFLWPSIGDHRQRLQDAVRVWLIKHPACCGALPTARTTAQPRVEFQMSATDLAKTGAKFSLLRPGMSAEDVLKTEGEPDAIDRGDDNPNHFDINLLGICADNRNENLAYIYFTERWTAPISRRDPLRDHYLLLFFSAEGKFTRMFSNVAEIPAIFPVSSAVWEQLMWGASIKEK
jgi:hypothetical protein